MFIRIMLFLLVLLVAGLSFALIDLPVPRSESRFDLACKAMTAVAILFVGLIAIYLEKVVRTLSQKWAAIVTVVLLVLSSGLFYAYYVFYQAYTCRFNNTIVVVGGDEDLTERGKKVLQQNPNIQCDELLLRSKSEKAFRVWDPDAIAQREFILFILYPFLWLLPTLLLVEFACWILMLTTMEGDTAATKVELVTDSPGLQRVAGCDNDRRLADVVFIHGLGGGSHTTWAAGGRRELFWPVWLAAEFPDLGIWTLGYDANPSGWQSESMPLADRGITVLQQLSSDGLGERPLIFVVHSMGGIVLKQMFREAETTGPERFKKIPHQIVAIVFIATPHSGSQLATFADYARLVFRTNKHVTELSAH